MEYFLLILITLATWIIHGCLVGLYGKRLQSRLPLFRFVHGSEIFLVTLLSMSLYSLHIASPPPLNTAGTVLLTLVIVDGIALFVNHSLAKQFDIYHFVVAYSAVFLATIIALSLTKIVF